MNTNMTSQQQFAEGTLVYDMNGDKVGKLSAYDPQGNYLVVEKGVLFPHELYVPVNSVASSDANAIQLNLSKSDLKDERYKTQPALSAGSALTQSSVLNEDAGNVTNRRAGVVEEAAPVAPITATGVDNQQMRGSDTSADTVNQNDISVPVREEELIAQKQQVEEGRIHVHKDVVTEQQNVTVPVMHEEVRVEHVPVEESAASDIGPDAFQGRDIEVPLKGETASTEKVAHVGEEIHLHKHQVTEPERLNDTARKERVRVDGIDDQGDVPLDRTDDNLYANDPQRP